MLQIYSLLDLTCVLDNRQVSNVKGENSHEIPTEDFSGETFKDICDIALETADDIFDIGGVETEDDEDILGSGLELPLFDESIDGLFEGCEIRE